VRAKKNNEAYHSSEGPLKGWKIGQECQEASQKSSGFCHFWEMGLCYGYYIRYVDLNGEVRNGCGLVKTILPDPLSKKDKEEIENGGRLFLLCM